MSISWFSLVEVCLMYCEVEFNLIILGISSWQHPILFLRDVPFVDLYTILEFIYMGEVSISR